MEKLLLVVFGPLAIAAALFVIVAGVRQLLTRLRSRLTRADASETGVYRNRLLNPQAAAVEHELGKLLSKRLLRLYGDRPGIQSGGFDVESPNPRKAERWPLYCFEPLDVEALNDAPYEEELGPGFCFATTGRSSWYWVAASDVRVEDSPVVFLDYDGGGRHGNKVAESLDEFLGWPRTSMN
jgi:hypothetical protein